MSDVQTVTLTEFLEARIAEDEAAAMGASHHSHLVHDYERDNYGFLWVKTTRVLAECEAKRRIVDGHAGWHVCPNLADQGYTDYGDGSGDEWEAICPTLRALALPFADHPDYRAEEWALRGGPSGI